MAQTNKHRESTWREQGSTKTRQGNKHATTQGRQTQKLDTDRHRPYIYSALNLYTLCFFIYSVLNFLYTMFLNLVYSKPLLPNVLNLWNPTQCFCSEPLMPKVTVC